MPSCQYAKFFVDYFLGYSLVYKQEIDSLFVVVDNFECWKLIYCLVLVKGISGGRHSYFNVSTNCSC